VFNSLSKFTLPCSYPLLHSIAFINRGLSPNIHEDTIYQEYTKNIPSIVWIVQRNWWSMHLVYLGRLLWGQLYCASVRMCSGWFKTSHQLSIECVHDNQVLLCGRAREADCRDKVFLFLFPKELGCLCLGGCQYKILWIGSLL
jgi:hypothetical protein